MHLAQLISLPIIGAVLVFILWRVTSNPNDETDTHAKEIINWQIAFSLYYLVSFMLLQANIGSIFLLILISQLLSHLLNGIFAVIGAARAYNGKIWNYPISIPFL